MTDAETSTGVSGQDARPGGDAGPGVQTGGSGQRPTVEWARQVVAQRRWLEHAGLLLRLTLLTAALVFPEYRASRARLGQEARLPGTWQPGEPPPAGVRPPRPRQLRGSWPTASRPAGGGEPGLLSEAIADYQVIATAVIPGPFFRVALLIFWEACHG